MKRIKICEERRRNFSFLGQILRQPFPPPNLTSREIVNVQPMSGPVGITFELRYKLR